MEDDLKPNGGMTSEQAAEWVEANTAGMPRRAQRRLYCPQCKRGQLGYVWDDDAGQRIVYLTATNERHESGEREFRAASADLVRGRSGKAFDGLLDIRACPRCHVPAFVYVADEGRIVAVRNHVPAPRDKRR